MTKKTLEAVLKGQNKLKNVKLRFRSIQAGYSLYLEQNKNYKRYRENLNIYISNKANDKIDNENKLRVAFSIQQKKENELIGSDKTLSNLKKETVFFLEYLKQQVDRRDELNANIVRNKPKNRNWQIVYRRLQRYFKKDLPIDSLSLNHFVELNKMLHSCLAPNTIDCYFRVIRTCLNQAVREGLIAQNPANEIRVKVVQVPRMFLTEEEVAMLIKTPCPQEQTRNAFLYSCFTGLRYSDLLNLRFRDLTRVEDSLFFGISQVKTGEVLRVKLNEDATKIIERQRDLQGDSEFVFSLSCTSYVSKTIKIWVARARIDKEISFHCARHTFATLLAAKGVDIYTASKLLGHTSIRPTQIYYHLVDKIKDSAIDKLPKFDLRF